MSTDRVISVFAILGVGLPMLFLVFDYAVFGLLTLADVLVRLLRHG
jgi:hypothetical protein